MTYVPANLRREVIERSGNCCEYCLLSQNDYPFTFHIEHIIAEKHKGKTVSGNLALSCPTCNTFKGSDIGSMDDENADEITPLYHPRKHLWSDHFRLDGAIIESLTAIGRVSVFLLQLNESERIKHRRLLIRTSRYPCQKES
jgi:hypothetical protein